MGQQPYSVLLLEEPRQKIARVRMGPPQVQKVQSQQEWIPASPGRSVQVVSVHRMPPKAGLSSRLGQARLLHDLANIELQALELGYRTYLEYPEAPQLFRQQLWQIVEDEARHLELCLNGLLNLQYEFGSFPVHLALWEAVSATDSLLQRLWIVHRYLEGSGLDAGETLLRRLKGVPLSIVHPIVAQIVQEEVAHVQFGNFWFGQLAQTADDKDFATQLAFLKSRLPKRMEVLSEGLRLEAGFTGDEILILRQHREAQISEQLKAAQSKRVT